MDPKHTRNKIFTFITHKMNGIEEIHSKEEKKNRKPKSLKNLSQYAKKPSPKKFHFYTKRICRASPSLLLVSRLSIYSLIVFNLPFVLSSYGKRLLHAVIVPLVAFATNFPAVIVYRWKRDLSLTFLTPENKYEALLPSIRAFVTIVSEYKMKNLSEKPKRNCEALSQTKKPF